MMSVGACEFKKRLEDFKHFLTLIFPDDFATEKPCSSLKNDIQC